MTKKPEEICENAEQTERWRRNEQLVNLDKIPETLVSDIENAYNRVHPGSRNKLYNYFFMNRLSKLTDVITDF